MALTENDLLDLTDDELDALFRRSPAGEIPDGDAAGKVLVGSEHETSPTTSRGSPRPLPGRARSSAARRASSRTRSCRSASRPYARRSTRRRAGSTATRRSSSTTRRRPSSPGTCATRSARSRRASTSGSCTSRRTRSSTSRSSSPSDPRAAAPTMPYQRSLTIVAPVRARRGERRREPARHHGRRRRQRLGDRLRRARGRALRAADDGARRLRPLRRAAAREPDPAQRLRRLRRTLTSSSSWRPRAPGIDRVFGRCEGYPEGEPTGHDRLDYLRRHVVREAARYVNTTGRTVRQIRQESALRDAIEAAPRRPGPTWDGRDPGDVRRAVRELVAAGSGARLGARAGGAAGALRRARGRRCISSPCRS